MWGLKKSVQEEQFKMDDDFLKAQIQKKLQNYTNTQGPAKFYGMAAAYGLTVEFEQVSPDALRRQRVFQSQPKAYAMG